MAGVDMVHVPYKGAGPALVDVMGGHVPIMFDNLPPSLEHIRAGKLRGLAVTTKERAPSIPELPTIAETLPGYETYTWNAFFAPAGTPKPIIDRAERGVAGALKDPEVTAKLKDLSATVVGSTPEELATHVKAELAKWAPRGQGIRRPASTRPTNELLGGAHPPMIPPLAQVPAPAALHVVFLAELRARGFEGDLSLDLCRPHGARDRQLDLPAHATGDRVPARHRRPRAHRAVSPTTRALPT